MKNILNNRILVILSIFVILITSLCTSCFASNDLTYSYNNKNYTVADFSSLIPEGFNYILCLMDCSDVPILFVVDKDTRQYIKITNHSLSVSNFYRYKFDVSGWIFKESYMDNLYYNVFNLGFIDGKYSILSSNINIYAYEKSIGDKGDEVVFQGAPQATQLSQIVEQAKTEKTLAEVVGILPLILVVVVSLVGLRKALKWLSTLLRRCLILLN